MSMLSELEIRLAEIEEKIGALLQQLKEHADLEKSLQNAGNDLTQANEELRKLANLTEITAQQLGEVLNAFQESVKILKRSDPARALKAVELVEEQVKLSEKRIQALIDKIQVSINEFADNSNKVQLKIAKKIEEVGDKILEGQLEITGKIKENCEKNLDGHIKVENKIRAEVESIRTRITAVVFLLGILILIIELYKFVFP